MINKLKYLLKEGWKVTIESGIWKEDDFQSYAQRGDINCPHRKEYDPKDGHGTSQVWGEGFENESPSKTLEESIDKLYDECLKVIPGKKWKKLK